MIPMALALILAAFAGAAIGLIWESSGSGEEAESQGPEGAAGTEGNAPDGG